LKTVSVVRDADRFERGLVHAVRTRGAVELDADRRSAAQLHDRLLARVRREKTADRVVEVGSTVVDARKARSHESFGPARASSHASVEGTTAPTVKAMAFSSFLASTSAGSDTGAGAAPR
jgi:hypothetical protein